MYSLMASEDFGITYRMVKKSRSLKVLEKEAEKHNKYRWFIEKVGGGLVLLSPIHQGVLTSAIGFLCSPRRTNDKEKGGS